MAAGLGSRMKPLTNYVPKPLIKVFGKSMIETVIDKLFNKVSKIYVVVGYKGDQFKYLEAKYKNVVLIENTEFETVNNISSIHSVGSILGSDDCFICEADLFISDDCFFDKIPQYSCYYGKFNDKETDDWVFDLDESGYITRVGKYGNNQFNMCGISFFKKREGVIIREKIIEAYKHKGTYEKKYWDDIVNENLSELNLKIYPVNFNSIIELDSEIELAEFDPNYQSYNAM